MQEVKVKLVKNINRINPNDWDACACPETKIGCRAIDPFTTHRFLAALEKSKSVGGETGWIPHHLVAKINNSIVGVMPLYLKSNSQGEYIFDHNWAHAYIQAGGNYYPKFQVAVPFTPVTGKRLLTKPGMAQKIEPILVEAVKKFARENQISSIHFTFCSSEEVKSVGERSLLSRQSLQYHWLNQGYENFDVFLSKLSSRKRKQIKKERKVVSQLDVDIMQLTGDDINSAVWDDFWIFYQDTGARKWGTPYLTRSFFDIVHKNMRDDILLVVAKRKNRYIAAALNFIGKDALFGRYWGCLEHHTFLHYELCYYQAIEYALKHKLRKIEAGAQGEHKLSRGYLPMITNSMHWFLNERFSEAVGEYVNQEKKLVQKQYHEMLRQTPFKNS